MTIYTGNVNGNIINKPQKIKKIKKAKGFLLLFISEELLYEHDI